MSKAPVLDLSAIPARERAAVEALLAEVAALKEITRRQDHLIAELNHALRGKRSEKLSEDDRQLAFEDLSIALAEVEEAKLQRGMAPDPDPKPAKPTIKHTIGHLPADLPRIVQVIEPHSLFRLCGCGEMHKIAEDREPNDWTSHLHNCASSSPCAPNMPAAPAPMAWCRRRPPPIW